jgi:gluconolactonase
VRDARILTDGLRFPEGPVVLPDGDLLVVELLGGCLTRIRPDGTKTTVAELGGSPNGAALGPDGAVYVCNSGGYPSTEIAGIVLPFGPGGITQDERYIGGRIQRVDLATGEWADLYTECGGIGLRGPNDLVFDAEGGFWFTDHGKRRERDEDLGGLYYARPDGSSITEVEHGLLAPNGIGISPAGDRLYVAETHTARLYAWPITGPGQVGGRELVMRAPGERLFDSLAVEAGGNVCVGSLAEGGITVVGPDGWTGFVPVPEDRLVTNICFDGTTAYLTLSSTGRVLVCEWDRPGLPLAWSSTASGRRPGAR